MRLRLRGDFTERPNAGTPRRKDALLWLRSVLEPEAALSVRGWTGRWTGPLNDDLEDDGSTLRHPVPPERWPFAEPSEHEAGCSLHHGGLFCDCRCSAEEEEP